jgi:hypothetical protein
MIADDRDNPEPPHPTLRKLESASGPSESQAGKWPCTHWQVRRPNTSTRPDLVNLNFPGAPQVSDLKPRCLASEPLGKLGCSPPFDVGETRTDPDFFRRSHGCGSEDVIEIILGTI